jgi:hypothetical protein
MYLLGRRSNIPERVSINDDSMMSPGFTSGSGPTAAIVGRFARLQLFGGVGSRQSSAIGDSLASTACTSVAADVVIVAAAA